MINKYYVVLQAEWGNPENQIITCLLRQVGTKFASAFPYDDPDIFTHRLGMILQNKTWREFGCHHLKPKFYPVSKFC